MNEFRLLGVNSELGDGEIELEINTGTCGNDAKVHREFGIMPK
jgi:hypothetical protein